MTSLEKPDLVTTNVRYRMPGVHPEGRKFVVIAAAVALFFWLVVGWDWLGWILLGVTLWVAAFFRDPIRTTPKGGGLGVRPAGRQGDDDPPRAAAARAGRRGRARQRADEPDLDLHVGVRRP